MTFVVFRFGTGHGGPALILVDVATPQVRRTVLSAKPTPLVQAVSREKTAWILSSIRNLVQDPWRKRARWGYDETLKFVHYWDNPGMIEVESPGKKDIVASAWFSPDGNLMVIIFNNTTLLSQFIVQARQDWT